MTDYWSPQRAARYDFWTPARIEQLKLLRAEGKSATEIAAELGAVSRNAIIGKLARLNIPTPPSRQKNGVRASSINGAKALARSVASLNGVRHDTDTQKQNGRMYGHPRAFTQDEIDGLDKSDCAVSIAQLQANHCRWIVGEPANFMYCGAVMDKWPYCARHNRFAYTPNPRRGEWV